MCRFDSAENCIFGFFTGDFQSHEKTKILFSKSVLASFIFHSRLICSVSADREDLQSDRRHRRAVSRFLAHRGPAPAPCCAEQVVVPSGFTPGSGPARGLSEGGHLEGQRVLPGAFALYRGGRTQDTQKSWLQKSERHLCQLKLSANFGPDDPRMLFCGDVTQDRGVKRHIRRLARTGRPKTLSDGFCHQFLY